jgi:hypothetical protein
MVDERPGDDAVGELVATAPDLLRHAFAQAVATLIDHLPEGAARNVAVSECIAAHHRCVERLARMRRLH